MGRVYDQLEPVDVSGDKFNQALPLGPEGLRHGTLDNGMKYFVRQCAKPKGRCALALAVRVGSVVEEEHERGIAHIVEHLAFNATESYSNHDIVRLLERVGAEFGACQNAYTSADETVYTLTVPTGEQDGLLDETLGVMSEMAFKIRCAPGDLSKERGSVLEEWRGSRHAVGRLQEAHWQLIFQGSRYADRLPIGLESVIRRCTADTVRSWYERWYRPQYMGLVAVGDFADLDAVVSLISRHMGSCVSRSSVPAPLLPTFDYMPHEAPRVKVLVDRETEHPSVYVSYKYPRPSVATPAEFLELLALLAFMGVVNNRLYKISREAQPPFISASLSDEPLCATASSLVMSAVALEGKVLPALEALLTEVARVRMYGIGPQEFERALRDLGSDAENTALEADQGYCTDIRDEYVRHFLYGEFVTGQSYEARLTKTLLPQLTREAAEAVAQRCRPSASCVVKVVDHSRGCTEQQLKQVLDRVSAAEAARTLGPWQEPPGPESLLPDPPPPLPLEQAVVGERYFPAPLDVTELTLCNGMRVCFKNTAFMRDELRVSCFAVGGLSEVPPDFFPTAALAGSLAGHLGLYGFRPDVLEDLLAGRRVSLGTKEGAYSRSVEGVWSPHDLETGMQLLHLLFKTEVRLVPDDVAHAQRLVRQDLEAQLRNPLTAYHERVRQINYGGCYYFKQMTLEEFERIDPALALAHHNMSWRNPGEFTMLLTGNIERSDLEPLLCRYLASLPPTGLPPPKKAQDVKPLPYSFPEAPVVEDVKVPMVSPVAQANLAFPLRLSSASAREEMVWVGLACRALETRLLGRMRFLAGDVYTVSVRSFFGCVAPSHEGDYEGDVSIAFSCDPANKDRLVAIALEEVSAMQRGEISAEEVATLVNLERLDFEESQAENSYWHELVASCYQSRSYRKLGGDIGAVYGKTLEAREKVLSEASPASLTAALTRLFPTPPSTRYTAISMLPRRPGMLYRMAAYIATLWKGGPHGPLSLQHQPSLPETLGGGTASPPAPATAITSTATGGAGGIDGTLLGAAGSGGAGYGGGDGTALAPAEGPSASTAMAVTAVAVAAVGAGLMVWLRSGSRGGGGGM